MVLADQVLRVDPRMILVEELRAVLAFAEEYLSSAWMDFGVLGDVVDYALVDGPAVVFGSVLFDLLGRVEHLMSVLGQLLELLGLFDEFLQKEEVEEVER